jgi:sirohydrochlorin cobaltochelatase
MKATKYVILVGHGGIPSDCPPSLVAEFKRLESAAKDRPSKELAQADAKLRNWPRTPQTDPYKTGLEAVAEALARRLEDHTVVQAYNEFCAPGLEEAFEGAVVAGAVEITVISTMFTRGGVHSETEIPEIVARLAGQHPKIEVRNVWPFSLDAVSIFLESEVKRVEGYGMQCV